MCSFSASSKKPEDPDWASTSSMAALLGGVCVLHSAQHLPLTPLVHITHLAHEGI